MGENVCPQCGAPITPGASECKYCGEEFVLGQINQSMNQRNDNNQSQNMNSTMYQQPIPPQTIYVQQPIPPQYPYTSAINPAWPIKNKIVAALLAIFLGWIGVHKFYLGKTGSGVLYLLFCWTGIPAVIGFIEGIIYLCSNDENFQLKHHVRLG